ncbi:unnamed protein product, partial [Oppiella nova]
DKEFHTERLASDQSVDIRVVGHVITHSTTFLIRIHGTFMIVAWLGCVSIAIFMARYFKHLWPEETLFGVQIWFAVNTSITNAIITDHDIDSIHKYLDICGHIYTGSAPVVWFGSHYNIGGEPDWGRNETQTLVVQAMDI